MDRRNTNGTFKSGHGGYKPKGAVSEIQKVTRQKMGEFLTSKLDDLDSIYEELPAKDKKTMLLAIAEFYLPKMKEVIMDNDVAQKTLTDYSRLKQETIDDLILHTTIIENE